MAKTPPKKRRRNFDQAVKEALLAGREGLLQLLGLINVVWLHELNTDVVAPQRMADIAWLVREAGRLIIIHIEIQIAPDNDMAFRIAEYGTRIHFREKYPVRSFVLYLKPTAILPVSPYATAWAEGRQNFHWDFEVIKLWELAPDSVLQTPYTDLWPLAVLMADTNVDLALRVARQIAVAPISAEQRDKLEGLVILLAGLRLPVAPLAQLLQEDAMIKDIFRHSSLRELLMQEVDQEKLKEELEKGEKIGMRKGMRKGLAEGRKKGRDEGRVEGRVEGRAEGQLEALRQVVVVFARQRFDRLSAAGRKRIEAITESERLQAAVLALPTFADEAALLAFLDAPASVDDTPDQAL